MCTCVHVHVYMYIHVYMCTCTFVHVYVNQSVHNIECLEHKHVNPFASGIKKVLLYPITGLFSVKIRKTFLAIKNFSVNDTCMSGQPNKRLIH